MPEHILSGIKAIVAMKLRRKGMIQREIAEIIKSDRSIVSHYLSGRYPKRKILNVAKTIEDLPPNYGSKLIHSLTDDKTLARNLIKELYEVKLTWNDTSCIACGSCLVCVSLTLDNFKIKIDENACYLCGSCTLQCPTNSLKFVKEE